MRKHYVAEGTYTGKVLFSIWAESPEEAERAFKAGNEDELIILDAMAAEVKGEVILFADYNNERKADD